MPKSGINISFLATESAKKLLKQSSAPEGRTQVDVLWALIRAWIGRVVFPPTREGC